MIRLSTVVFGLVAFCVGCVLFRVKYEVVDLEIKHVQVKRSIQSTKESLHILKAEWAHLTDPRRIQRLAVKYLDNGESLGAPQDSVDKKEIKSSKDSSEKNKKKDVFVQKQIEKKSLQQTENTLDDLLAVSFKESH